MRLFSIKSYIAFTILIVLAIGMLPMPYGYYSFLKITVFVGGLYYIADLSKKGNNLFICIFAVLVILHNPIIPVRLGVKEAWNIINIITIACFFIKADIGFIVACGNLCKRYKKPIFITMIVMTLFAIGFYVMRFTDYELPKQNDEIEKPPVIDDKPSNIWSDVA